VPIRRRKPPARIILLPTLTAAIGLLTAACGGNGQPAAARPGAQHFHSRPDLVPPTIDVRTPAHDVAPGYIFFGPKKEVKQQGALIVDNDGGVVWFHPVKGEVADFRVQHYRGRPVLTWWEGHSKFGIGRGKYEIVDSSYRKIAEVRAGHGLRGDLHEFQLTPRNTALITIYNRVPADLSSVGGPRHGFAFDSIVQEIDVASGRVLFEWHSIGHVALTESYQKLRRLPNGKPAPDDYFHVNSIAEDGPNLLISGRNTHALYEISRRDGRVLWRLGGKRSDFQMGPGTNFEWQHDARRHHDGTLTLFDNGAMPKEEDHSRALVLHVDTVHKTVTLVRAYVHPKKLLAPHQGNMQVLPDGHVFVGYGGLPYFTEFSPDGHVLYDATFGEGADSYRAYRFVWTGHPAERPAVAVVRKGGRATVYASWNGATNVTRWQVLAGPDRAHLTEVAAAPKDGFETAIGLSTKARYVAVRAVDGSGAPLRESPVVAR
jgi:hypothetical protein